ncbi:MAG TPA: ATP synthase subunit I [Candidatus Angelobacter sp.]|nr:ATP synthase subunit I [Candidatus Angelobacter sp.]
MNVNAESLESRLSGAYRRILRVAIVLSVATALAAAIFVNWQAGLGVAIGSLIAYLNFVWLHRGTERLVERMLATENKATKTRFVFPSLWRYLLIMAALYVIFKGYPRMLVGFIVGLALPVLASMAEGIYEAIAISKIDQAPE